MLPKAISPPKGFIKYSFKKQQKSEINKKGKYTKPKEKNAVLQKMQKSVNFMKSKVDYFPDAYSEIIIRLQELMK